MLSHENQGLKNWKEILQKFQIFLTYEDRLKSVHEQKRIILTGARLTTVTVMRDAPDKKLSPT